MRVSPSPPQCGKNIVGAVLEPRSLLQGFNNRSMTCHWFSCKMTGSTGMLRHADAGAATDATDAGAATDAIDSKDGGEVAYVGGAGGA